MKTQVMNRNIIVSIFAVMLLTYSTQGMCYGQNVPDTVPEKLPPSIIASTPYPLTEATLNGSIVTLRLTSESYSFISRFLLEAPRLSGIGGITIARTNRWTGHEAIRKVSDTEITVELRFSGSISKKTTLKFTVDSDQIEDYKGPPLTAEISVSATTEVEPTGKLVASTPFPLTKATLNDNFVVLTLHDSHSYIVGNKSYYNRNNAYYLPQVGVSGIDDVRTGVFASEKHVIRLSSSEIMVRIDFQGDFNTDVTLTFTVPPRIIENYDGPPLTAELPVTVETDLQVLIPELQQQPMFWVNTNTGKIESTEYFDAITNAVTVLTVDRAGEKLYWGEHSKSGGVIKRANFDGTDVEALVALSSVPRGIVVDSVRNKMYWTNSDLQIQTANLNGEGISPVIQLEEEIGQERKTICSGESLFLLLVIPLFHGGGCSEEIININLTSPTDIAVNTVDGRLYWTEFSGRIRRVNLDGTGLGTLIPDIGSPYGITVVDNKVYWAEEIDEYSGKIQRANPNGTNIETLAKVQGLPTGISVDTEAGKVYWANSLGGIQRTDLNGGEVEVVVSGITSPGDFVLVPDAQSRIPAIATELKTDVNGDGIISLQDLVLTALNYGQTGQNPADVNGDGIVNIEDLILIAGVLDADAAAPSLHPQTLEILTATQVKQWLSAAEQLDLTDATSQRGVLFLHQLLMTLTPQKTVLLANYPNPFNPETWIPYQLATDADVTLHIYAVNGTLVRTLTLGHQPAGIYQSRGRAAYWDGRNAFGEPVASGVYFYTLSTESTRDSVTAGNFTATRKMLIRK